MVSIQLGIRAIICQHWDIQPLSYKVNRTGESRNAEIGQGRFLRGWVLFAVANLLINAELNLENRPFCVSYRNVPVDQGQGNFRFRYRRIDVR